MNAAFVDTGYLLALEITNDQHHQAATQHWQRIVAALPRLVTTSYVFDEVVTFFNSRGQHAKALQVGNNLLQSPSVQFIHVDTALFYEGWAYFQRHQDKDYSLTDCISFLVMQKLGIRRYTIMTESKLFVGNVEVLALTDSAGDFPFPLSQLFPTVPAEAWAPFRQRYPELFSGPDTWHNHYGCYLLRSQGRTILVDTGIGSKATNPGMVNTLAEGIDGRLLAELQAAGVRPEEVDTVFFTHLHPDHVGWNLSQGGANPRPTFPRARYVVHQTDWSTFQQPEVQAAIPFSYWEETLGPLETLGVLDLLTGECALTNEITAIPTPGHTPGHMSLAIVSGGQQALIMGDVAIHPAQVTETDWSALFDMDQQLAAQVRRQVLDRVEAEHTTLVACHFPEPGFGHLVRVEGRRYWQGL